MVYVNSAVIPPGLYSSSQVHSLKNISFHKKIHHSVITESEKVNEHYRGSKQYSISLLW